LTDKEIRRAVEADPEAHPTDVNFWKNARVTIRLDADLLGWLRRQGLSNEDQRRAPNSHGSSQIVIGWGDAAAASVRKTVTRFMECSCKGMLSRGPHAHLIVLKLHLVVPGIDFDGIERTVDGVTDI
jgi:hypothetical protein